MRIVYFGTDVFYDIFAEFCRSQTVLALYTYHNPEDYFREYRIKKLAEEYQIPVHYESITPEEIQKYIDLQGCDLFFTAEYDRLIPLDHVSEKFRGINIHSSILPEGRSYYPIECALLQKKKFSGVTLHKMISKLDSGDIIAQTKFAISSDEDSIDVYLKCAAAAYKDVMQLMEDFDSRWNQAVRQDVCLAYWKRPSEEHMIISHQTTCKEASEIYRVFNEMTMLGGGKNEKIMVPEKPLMLYSSFTILERESDFFSYLFIPSKDVYVA
ncbi:MAG: hypothetical protein EOM64_06285, partial [Erysipelotrichia bacterium]|nr:hypothetical protein [Erysipelotrichia bacterium]